METSNTHRPEPVQFVARPYLYANNVPWNEDRYEIFYWSDRKWVPVGGLIKNRKIGCLAFICTKQAQRHICAPAHVPEFCPELYVWGATEREALDQFKETYPDPVRVLDEVRAEALASF